MRLVKETEAHVLLGLFLLLNGGGSRLLGSSSGGNGGSGGEFLRVLNAVLEFISLRNAVVRVDRDSQEVLVTVGDQVGNGSNGGVTSGQRDGSNLGDRPTKLLIKVLSSTSRTEDGKQVPSS